MVSMRGVRSVSFAVGGAAVVSWDAGVDSLARERERLSVDAGELNYCR